MRIFERSEDMIGGWRLVQYSCNGAMHRLDGPAHWTITIDGRKVDQAWYLYGVEYNASSYQRAVSYLQNRHGPSRLAYPLDLHVVLTFGRSTPLSP